jgi:hypothetical protein
MLLKKEVLLLFAFLVLKISSDKKSQEPLLNAKKLESQ